MKQYPAFSLPKHKTLSELKTHVGFPVLIIKIKHVKIWRIQEQKNGKQKRCRVLYLLSVADLLSFHWRSKTEHGEGNRTSKYSWVSFVKPSKQSCGNHQKSMDQVWRLGGVCGKLKQEVARGWSLWEVKTRGGQNGNFWGNIAVGRTRDIHVC